MMISTKGRYALRVLIDMAEAPEGRLYPAQGDCQAAGDFGEVPREHHQAPREGSGARGTARQGRGIPPVRGAGSAHRRGRAAADGGVARAGRVSGEGGLAL